MISPAEIFSASRRTLRVLRQSTRPSIVGFISLAGATSSGAAECVFPDNIDWVVNNTCEVSGIRIAPQNLTIANGATLTVESSGEIILDMRNFAVNVAPNARLIVAPGGRLRSNQIGPLLARQSAAGGTFGYFLKQVGGPVLDTINPDLPFHPSSAIKVLYMIEALRQVDNGALNLGTTNLTVCRGPLLNQNPLITAGGSQTCPNSFLNAAAGSSGFNCSHGEAPANPLVSNNSTTCGGSTQSLALGVGVCAMMKVSNNPSGNAIQEAVGGGNPQTGWNNIINNAGAAIGLTSTTFGNRFGCSGPFESPTNTTTLRDLALSYEQMATNPAVLFPSTPPLPFLSTDAYSFMNNDVDSLPFVAAIVNEQAGEAGIDATTTANFISFIRLAQKGGSNDRNLNGCNIGIFCVPGVPVTGCPGGGPAVPNCPDPTQTLYRTAAGWISLPINGGANTRDYVFGVFVNSAASSIITSGTTPLADPAMPLVSIIPGSMLDEAGELLRPVIREALENF
jgi:hypothetical protein